jgi:Na+-driven multidrug efflux pump
MKNAIIITRLYCLLSAILMFIITGHHIGHIEKYNDIMHHVSNFFQALTWCWLYYLLNKIGKQLLKEE